MKQFPNQPAVGYGQQLLAGPDRRSRNMLNILCLSGSQEQSWSSADWSTISARTRVAPSAPQAGRPHPLPEPESPIPATGPVAYLQEFSRRVAADRHALALNDLG